MQSIQYQSVSSPLLFSFGAVDVPHRHEAIFYEKIEADENEIKNNVVAFVQSETSVIDFFNQFQSKLFDFRIKALRELLWRRVSLSEAQEHFFERIERTKQQHPELRTFCENVEFALRANIRGLRRVLPEEILDVDGNLNLAAADQMPPVLKWEHYLTVLSSTMPPRIFQLFFEWFSASLAIEFSAIVLLIVEREKLELSSVRINELALFAAESGQEFGAISRQIANLGKMQGVPKPSSLPASDDMAEQTELAELGIEDYAAALSNE